MKKKILISFFTLLATIVIWQTAVSATTYEEGHFSIDIPAAYTTEIVSGELEATSSDQRKVIRVEETEHSYDMVIDEEYKSEMEKTFEEIYGADFTLISSQVIEQNACKGLDMKFRQDISGVYIYMNLYQFISDNYNYVVIFASYDKSYLTSTEKTTIMNSFKIKDTVVNSNGIPFIDVSSGSWYYDAVKYVYNKNIISGTNEYTYKPSANLTRGMLVTILYRMDGQPTVTGTTKFKDVTNTSAYYYKAVKWASDRSIVSGYDSGVFKPNDYITREQLAVMLSNYCRYKGKYKASSALLSNYADGAYVSSYAKTAMKWAVGNNVITGSNNYLKPQGTATRAETASMIYKYCSNIK